MSALETTILCDYESFTVGSQNRFKGTIFVGARKVGTTNASYETLGRAQSAAVDLLAEALRNLVTLHNQECVETSAEALEFAPSYDNPPEPADASILLYPRRDADMAVQLRNLADELEAGKLVRRPDGEGPFGLLDGELVPLQLDTVQRKYDLSNPEQPFVEWSLYRFPVPEDPTP